MPGAVASDAGATADDMRTLDSIATRDYAIPILLLMEHAGLAVANALLSRLPTRVGARIVCVAGTGYNGGDGLAAMRLLHGHGCVLRVFLAGARAALRDEPLGYARMLEQLSIPVEELSTPAAWQRLEDTVRAADWIIDALLGTGARGAPRPPAARAIAMINAAQRPVLAVDAPSGLNVDTGAVASVAVRARVTVTFGAVKRGFFVGEGPRRVGECLVETITFPPALLQPWQAA